jgi:RNA polymerase sigma factor (TIGR02999 family)
VGENRGDVTRLLEELRMGNEEVRDELFAICYEELRQLAHRQRRRWRWRGDHTLNSTALVHEAFLKLSGGARLDARGRAHFYAIAATAMRHILCNYARDRRARKRGGGVDFVPFDGLNGVGERGAVPTTLADTLADLDDALRRLERIDPRRAQVVECRFFGGLTVEETAAALGVSPRTVKRDWSMAQAWLYREMSARE